MDDPAAKLGRMMARFEELVRDRREYEQNDALEGVIECNGALSELRLEIKAHCAACDLPLPPGI